ncbi:Alpha/beta hydrolase fold-1 [Cynara cardunculus var. scolymus]|uniref:Alpha/beta hydrolase fold-1 n=1 Tax=Cynara cardunculus var. scolymus TaxID=59895 RepID=A0A103XJH2_CYNCS|nr:Alpha/beta hydrolase fold-1 [Cynara cardunculus var. scolymus]
MWVVENWRFDFVCHLGSMGKTTRSVLGLTGKFINDFLSFLVFSVLDVLDLILCYVYKTIDFFVEAEWKPCYCSSPKQAIISSGNILVSENGEAEKIVCLTSAKLQLEEISDTLYTRPSVVLEVSKTTVKRRKVVNSTNSATVQRVQSSPFVVNNTLVELLQEKISAHKSHPVPRWSDCDCDTSFWTETLFPNFSRSIKSKYRLFAIDLLGFGKSPKPHDSLYTMKEHLDMIERSVLEPNKIESFHIVAHSLGCILALALAVKYPNSVKSLTLLAPPFFPTPKGEEAAQYMMRKVAPRRLWPLIAFGASMACWYEHVSRTICLLICKHHRTWEFLAKLITRNSINVFHGRDDELIPVECCDNIKAKVPRANVKVVEKKDHITIVVGRQQTFARELEHIWKTAKTS